MATSTTPLTVGRARLATLVLHNPDGSINTTAAVTATPGNPAIIRVTMNPGNPREVAVVGVGNSFGVAVNANASAPVGPGGAIRSGSSAFVVGPASDQSDLQFGDFGPEIDPPSWA
jgi:hypothetical protein